MSDPTPSRPADPSPRGPAGWFSHPILSALTAATWLLLQQSLTLADLLAAALVGLIIPRAVHRLIAPPAHPRHLGTIIRLAGVVVWDIVIANVAVAQLVLSPRRQPRPAWIAVPLDIRDPTAVTLMASIITITPGTVSCVIDEDRHIIYVHALDCDDADAMAAEIKQRYERPLQEIFEWPQG